MSHPPRERNESSNYPIRKKNKLRTSLLKKKNTSPLRLKSKEEKKRQNTRLAHDLFVASA